MSELRKQFRQYCPLSAEEQRSLRHGAIYILDANVLLHAYRYSKEVREQYFDVLRKTQDRLWIPHQVAYELYKNRASVIATQAAIADQVSLKINTGFETVAAEIDKALTHRYHPFLDKHALQKQLRRIASNLAKQISAATKSYPAQISEDPILEALEGILEGRVGLPFSNVDLVTLYLEADKRYEADIPPGYKDKVKPKPDRYGDYLLWKQILAYFSGKGCAAVFVTDENKEDWLLRASGRTVWIRPELREEFHSTVGQPIWIWTSEYFIQEITRQSGEKLNRDVIAEISDNSALAARNRELAGVLSALSPSLSDETLRRMQELTKSPILPEETVRRFQELMKGPSLPEETVRRMQELTKGPILPEETLRRMQELTKSPILPEETVRRFQELMKGPSLSDETPDSPDVEGEDDQQE